MLALSPLGHTWFLDLDGTLLKHNGYLIDGTDSLLPGARDFIASIPKEDLVIIVTSRERKHEESTRAFLANNGIRFDYIIFDAPYGERIVVNDNKPSGLEMAYAVSISRDKGPDRLFLIDNGI